MAYDPAKIRRRRYNPESDPEVPPRPQAHAPVGTPPHQQGQQPTPRAPAGRQSPPGAPHNEDTYYVVPFHRRRMTQQMQQAGQFVQNAGMLHTQWQQHVGMREVMGAQQQMQQRMQRAASWQHWAWSAGSLLTGAAMFLGAFSGR